MQDLIDGVKWVFGLIQPANLQAAAGQLGWLSYALLAGIVFAETGLLVGFLLPGDSLLFAVGVVCGLGALSLPTVLVTLTVAAIVGDAVNYLLGRWAGVGLVASGRLPLVKPHHLAQAEAFYAKHGPKAIILCRFVPIVRTFVPFVAGAARMDYPTFAFYNVFGGLLWVVSMTLAGYLLGAIPLVQQHFEKVVVLIVVVSVVPMAWEFYKARREPAAPAAAPTQADAAPPA